MPSYPLLQVDAFTATPLRGNPAAVVLDAAGLADATMQAIAREMNLSETAFVSPPQTDGADFAARFFTPAKEIPLPGHPIIATAQALTDAGRWGLAPGSALRLETRRGIVPVTHRDDAPGPRWIITQPRPEWGRHYAPELVAPLLSVTLEDIVSPPQTVSTGTPQLMIMVRSPELLDSLHPDLGGLERLTFEGDFFSIHVFALSGRASGTDVYARHFAPAAGVTEDPSPAPRAAPWAPTSCAIAASAPVRSSPSKAPASGGPGRSSSRSRATAMRSAPSESAVRP